MSAWARGWVRGLVGTWVGACASVSVCLCVCVLEVWLVSLSRRRLSQPDAAEVCVGAHWMSAGTLLFFRTELVALRLWRCLLGLVPLALLATWVPCWAWRHWCCFAAC